MDSFTQKTVPQKNSKCEICEKCFTSKNSKEKHIGIVHGEEKEFECNVCSRVFGNPKTHLNHVKNSHQKSKRNHKCDSCQKWFIDSGNLKYHIKTFHEVKKLQMSSLWKMPCFIRRSKVSH